MPVKGTNGYIKKRKILLLLLLIGIVALSLGLFLCGYLTTGTKKNLLTVLSILGVLPAAKCLVNLVLFLPHKSLDETVYKDLESATAETGILYSDLVFTSTKHVMHLDSLYITGTELVGLSLNGKVKSETEITEYFTDTMKKRGTTVHMHVFRNAAEMKSRIEALADKPAEVPEELKEFVSMILV